MVSTACACAIIPQKTWESVYVWKLSVRILIISVSSKGTAVCQLKYLHSIRNVEDNCRLYEGKDAFLRLPTSFVSQYATLGAVICVLDRKQTDLGRGRGSCAIILLVSPFGSPTIAKFNGVRVHCFAVALFQLCTYTTII